MEKLNAYLEDKNALITTSVNRHHLTGFRSSLGYLFIVGGKKILYVDSRYIEAVGKKSYADVEVRLFKKLSDVIKEIITEFKITEIEYESDITLRQDKSFKELFGNVKAGASEKLSNLINSARSVKTQKEVSYIVKAQRAAEAAFDNILDFIKPGVTEREIKLRLEYEMQLHGAEGMSFSTIAISGKNTSMPHGVPTEKVVESGDFVTMDFGGIYEGYCSDMTRTIAVGFVTDEMEKVYNTVLEAQLSAIEKTACGVATKDVDAVARSIIAKTGYGEYFQHSTGHGVGLEVHEQPNLSPNSDQTLTVGNVVTIEPGIYLPKKFGVRIEDMLYIGENGVQNLTNSQKNLIILK